jgi:nucleotide-binding universal stress UspA family protein
LAATGERGAKAGGIRALRRILVPLDLSPLSVAAVPYAYGVAAREGTVHLLHVIEHARRPNPLYAHYTPGRTPSPEERERQEAEIRATLAALVPAEAARRGVHSAIEVVEAGEVGHAICDAAERLDVDAVFLGTHGRGGLARALLGSVAQEVLRGTGRPVLMVRTGAT